MSHLDRARQAIDLVPTLVRGRPLSAKRRADAEAREMSNELMPAITLLEGEYDEMVRNANALLGTINVLRQRAGLPPKGPGGAPDGSSGGGGTITQIKPDTFYGKKLQTAVREYLEMRKAQSLGPAKPREIYEAVTAGGFQFETSSDEVALVGLRAMLRKRTNFFHRLPNGTYGLTIWYPHAKPAKTGASTGAALVADADDDDMSDAADDDIAEAV